MDITSYLVGASPYDNGFTLNYGDSGKWYIIAEYNNIINPFTELKGGMVLMIPAYGS